MKINEILKENTEVQETKYNSDALQQIFEAHQSNDWDSMDGAEYLKRLQQGILPWQQ